MVGFAVVSFLFLLALASPSLFSQPVFLPLGQGVVALNSLIFPEALKYIRSTLTPVRHDGAANTQIEFSFAGES